MNCKQGDLAIVVEAHGSFRSAVGRIVRCEALSAKHSAAWVVDPPLTIQVGIGHVLHCEAVGDECLRPIRDPGDDAVDETLSWVPVPVRDEVMA